MQLWPSTHLTEDSVNSFMPKINWNCTLFPISLIEQTSSLLFSDSLEKLQSLGKGLSTKPLWKWHFNTRIKFTTCFKELQETPEASPTKASCLCHCPLTLFLTSKLTKVTVQLQRDWPHTRNIRGAAAPTTGFKGVKGMESAPLWGSRAASNSPGSEERGQGGRGQGGIKLLSAHTTQKQTAALLCRPQMSEQKLLQLSCSLMRKCGKRQSYNKHFYICLTENRGLAWYPSNKGSKEKH